MKEPKLYYDCKSKHDLKDPYPHFYYSMLKYIDSLPDQWFFSDCTVVDYDGYRFVLTLHDGRNNKLCVSAVKTGSTYLFESNKL